jgi:hypothetical protein
MEGSPVYDADWFVGTSETSELTSSVINDSPVRKSTTCALNRTGSGYDVSVSKRRSATQEDSDGAAFSISDSEMDDDYLENALRSSSGESYEVPIPSWMKGKEKPTVVSAGIFLS